jgi:hypothetical protein
VAVRELTEETIRVALGRDHRHDPVLERTGGPAGNARLVSWHIAVGALLVLPALLKTATTGWRIVRFYAAAEPYRAAGPPPIVLRVLGPLVVLSTLGILGTGVALVLVGTARSHQTLVSAVGVRLDAITLHQASFAVWAVATGLHTLGRLLPALQATVVRVGGQAPSLVPGRRVRLVLLVAMLAVGALLAGVLVRGDGAWSRDRHYEGPPPLRSSKAT